MRILNSIRTRKVHFTKLGAAGFKFLKETKHPEVGKLIELNVKDYGSPIYLRNKTSDIPTFYQCIYHEEYDIKFPFEPKVIVDLGANIGLTTRFFKKKYPQSKIIAIEPENSNFEILKKNTEGLADVELENKGIWYKQCDLKIVDGGQGHYGFTVMEANPGDKDVVPAESIPSLMNKYQLDSIDVLKVDVEGTELELFANGSEEWLSKCKCIIVEMHDRMKPGCSKAVFSALINYNFEFEMKGENAIFFLNKQ